MAFKILFTTFLTVQGILLFGQQRLGINTSSPVRTLEVAGSGDQHIRIHTSSAGFGAEAGLELVRGLANVSATDWRIVNDGGAFKILYGNDNFTGPATEALRINSSQETGIGTNSPSSKLHIDGGTQIAFGGHGYLKIGNLSSYNLAFDNGQIQALNNDSPAPLYFQANGGNTHFGLNGGNTYMALSGGGVGVGTTDIIAPLTIVDDNFQLDIDNDADDANHWHIGASNDAWQAGGNQLLFSPSSNSADAVLRLLEVSDNDGNMAPVMIHTTTDHTLLLDGNEIDTRATPLYINYNTEEETYINPSGGMVGIGTTNPQAMLHVNTASGNVLTIQNSNAKWHFNPATSGDGDLNFYYNNMDFAIATVDGVSGQWTHISDREVKDQITPLTEVMEKLKELHVYHYTMKYDTAHQTLTGIMAQEAESLFPAIVSQNEGQYGVSYSQLAAIGVRAIQEQQLLIEQLKDKVAKLLSLSNPTSSTKETTETNKNE
jgi:hypothetical protein